MKSNLGKFLLILAIIFANVGCQSSQPAAVAFSATETERPEIELSPTKSLTPSPLPTATETPTPTDALTPSNTPTRSTKLPEPTATTNRLSEGVEAVSIRTEDGLDLAGFLHIPSSPLAEPIAVLLAHEYYSIHHSWEWLAEQLANEGFTTLTFDARGHGNSPGSKFVNSAGIDTKASVNFLNLQGYDEIICLGTSMGGSGCLVAAVEMELAGLGMLSSPMNIGGSRLITHQDIENLTIPKLFMVAEEDRVGADFVAEFIEMTEIAAEPKDIHIYPGDAHASELFFADAGDEVQEILFNFVTGFSQSAQEQPAVMISSMTVADCASMGLPEIACTGVSSNDEWVPIIREFDGIPMVLVPAGCFMMGSTDEQIEYYLTLLDRRRLYANEQPAHQICFSEPFWIDMYEVTNGFYGSYGLWQENDQPRESLTWLEAEVYCQDRGTRLPTEAEWEYAARGPDNLIYPWGNTFDPSRLNYCDTNCNSPGADSSNDDGFLGTAPVGSFPEGVSWVGAQDMAGNVWERVSSILLPYPYDPKDGREATVDENETSFRGVRGGGWSDQSYVVRSANRNERENTNYSAIYGLRCARSFNSDPGKEYTGESSPTLLYEPPTDAQLGNTWNRPNDGSVMVYVPGGTFQMGTGTSGRTNAGQYEFPEHPVKLDSFWIDKYEVTNKQFAEFMYVNGNQVEGGVTWLEMESEFCLIEDRNGIPWPKVGFENHPVIDVSWYGAQAYCEWIGGRLPTESEWEYAASGPENWIYPWGNEYDCTKGNFHDWTDENEPKIYTWVGERGCDGIDHTSPVDAYPEGASWVGALDMAGNVWDWVSNWGFSFYPTGLEINPTGPETGIEKIVRGGSWNNHETGVRTTMRGTYRPINRSYYIGFRCAYDEFAEDTVALKTQTQKPTKKSNLAVADCLAVGLPSIACTGVSQNDEWIPIIQDFNGIPMLLVPSGCFNMGNSNNLPEERPVHEICFDRPFWIDHTEVTVAKFANFLNEQIDVDEHHNAWMDVWGITFEPHVQLEKDDNYWKPLPGHDNQPIKNIRWFGALDYCTWRGAYLPSEAEWEYAARGPDSWLYPWGNEFIADNVVRHAGRWQRPDVGSKPQGASWVGALDMSSSLFEWTSSLYRPYPYDANDGRENGPEMDDTSERVLRGSAWYHPDGMHDNVSATARFNDPPGYGVWYFGFRCARSIE